MRFVAYELGHVLLHGIILAEDVRDGEAIEEEEDEVLVWRIQPAIWL